MGTNSYFKQKPLTLIQQQYYMRLSWPAFTVSQSGNTITWIGNLKPAAMWDTYTLKISYTVPKRPDITVLAPQLRTLPGKTIPHTFRNDGTLCLHLNNEWNGGKIIANTIVHWIARWLFFYETWLITGDWEGEGHEPPSEQNHE